MKTPLDLKELLAETALYNHPSTPKQADIIKAAETLFAQSGFAETSTASIAKLAGVTEKTLFKHFPTKQDLLRRILFPLIVRTVVPYQIAMLKKFFEQEHGSFKSFFIAIAKNRWEEARSIGPKLKFLLVEILQEKSTRHQAVQLFKVHAKPLIVERIKHYQQIGEIRSDLNPQSVAELLVMIIVGKGLLRGVIAPEEHYQDDQDLEETFQIVFSGLKV